jgi:N-sulfoglucosamine sulfohydrolase
MEMRRAAPNVVLITCHDLGRYLGCYGIATVETPNLDRLAREGVRFTRAFATAPQCSPSRASIFTGRYPHSNGVMGLTHGEFGWDLHPYERHLAATLRAEGYATALIGILHEARSYDRLGFETVTSPGHDARETSRLAVAALDDLSRQSHPFYLQLGYHEPHRIAGRTHVHDQFMGFVGDYIAPHDDLGVTVPGFIRDEPEARREIAELQGAVRHLDRAVGEVLVAISAFGLSERTLVVFTTDHGLALPRSKCTLYDPGIEVALLVRWPGAGWPGEIVSSALVSNVDIFPTILELAGVPSGARVQGRSLVPLLRGKTLEHCEQIFAEMTYHDYYDPKRCVRTDRRKLIVNFSTAPSFMDPTQSWNRRIRPAVPEDPALSYGPAVELYDLETDPLEWNNLADEPGSQTVRRQLLARLLAWMRDTGDPLLDGAVTSPRHRVAVETLLGSAG